ncbi:GSCOCG00004043001-RA-CDS [Cotesia congregata]|nr:GSCOCG00004043001-RA-CDS [Cotesia congregata]
MWVKDTERTDQKIQSRKSSKLAGVDSKSEANPLTKISDSHTIHNLSYFFFFFFFPKEPRVKLKVKPTLLPSFRLLYSGSLFSFYHSRMSLILPGSWWCTQSD